MSLPEGPAVRVSSVPKTPGVRKVMPAPFERPSISVGSPAAARRQWRVVAVTSLRAGDTIAHFGRVSAVHEQVSAPDAGSGLGTAAVVEHVVWTVTVIGTDVGQGAPERVFAGAGTVYAYTRAEVDVP
jgi:hypothetical protein